MTMKAKLPNLLVNKKTGKMWLVNNCLGLADGYQYKTRSALLTGHILRAFCLFRREVADRVEKFASEENIISTLLGRVNRLEGLFGELHDGSTAQMLLKHYLQNRVNEAALWIKLCRKRYAIHN